MFALDLNASCEVSMPTAQGTCDSILMEATSKHANKAVTMSSEVAQQTFDAHVKYGLFQKAVNCLMASPQIKVNAMQHSKLTAACAPSYLAYLASRRPTAIPSQARQLQVIRIQI